MELAIYCPNVLGNPWVWNDECGVWFRWEGSEPWCLDEDYTRHKLKKDEERTFYYLHDAEGAVFWLDGTRTLVRRT